MLHLLSYLNILYALMLFNKIFANIYLFYVMSCPIEPGLRQLPVQKTLYINAENRLKRLFLCHNLSNF